MSLSRCVVPDCFHDWRIPKTVRLQFHQPGLLVGLHEKPHFGLQRAPGLIKCRVQVSRLDGQRSLRVDVR